MFCINCGNKIDENAKFCTKCGATVSNYQNQQDSAAGNNNTNNTNVANANSNYGNATAANANCANANANAVNANSNYGNANYANANYANSNYANATAVNPNYSSNPNYANTNFASVNGVNGANGANANATAANANYANVNANYVNANYVNAPAATYAPAAPAANTNYAPSTYVAAANTAATYANTAAAPAAKTSRKSLIAISISATLAVALILAGTLWYFLREREVVVPKFAASEKIENITKTLASNGIKSQVVDEFSGKKPGSFLRYLNVKPNSRIPSSYVVKVARSKGPGVPAKGVVGKSLKSAKNILESMGVPVKVHYVVSSKSGQILASNPVPGYSIGKEKAIHIAVGDSTLKGVPTSLFGMNKDAAYKKMLNRSYNVKLRPKFSSKKYLNKIVGAFPSLGSQLSGGDLTLYYGVDASQTKNTFLHKDQPPYMFAQMNADSIAGLWCSKSGDCLDLRAPAKGDIYHESVSLYSSDLPYDQNSYEGYKKSFDVCNITHDPTNCYYSTDGSSDNPIKNHLLYGNSGVVEIYKYRGAPYCGNKLVDDSIAFFCVNGTVIDQFNRPESMMNYGKLEDIPGYAKGASFRMDEFLLLVPLNAKLDAVEKSGYFVGKGSKRPDMSRPFILRRNPKLYKKTKVDVTNKHWSVNYNPFVPTMFNKPVKFAPAPDDDNAYYLVEQPFDWSSIPDESL